MQKKILITGAAGFAGKYLLELLSQTNATLIASYHSPKSLELLAPFKERVIFQSLDITNKEAIEATIKEIMPDEVYHLAAQSSPGDSFRDPENTLKTNIFGQLYLLEAIRTHSKHTRVIVLSSSEIYGEIPEDMLPLNENSPFFPNNPYAVSKITQDYLALQYYLAYKTKTVRVRAFNHIGPGQTDRFVVARFAKKIAEIEKGREPVIEVGNLEAKRDFTDVRDIVRAYTMLMEKGKDGEVYNVGSGKSYRIGDIMDMLLSFSSVKIQVKESKDLFRPTDIPELLCDCSKVASEIGWKPEIPIETSLKNTLDYWREIV